MEKLRGIKASHPDQCTTLQLDVTDTFESLSVKAKEALAVWGRLDVLVNNAGHGMFGTIEEAGCVSLSEFHRSLIPHWLLTQSPV